MGRSRKNRRRAKKQGKGKTSKGKRKLRVTWPNGKVTHEVDDGRHYPKGTMVSWDAPGPSGRPEMRWTVVGGGWPFDD